MTHTRTDPPTIEVRMHTLQGQTPILSTESSQELLLDLERRRRILHNAAVLEAQERMRVAHIAASERPSAPLSAPNQSGHPNQEQSDQDITIDVATQRPTEPSSLDTRRPETRVQDDQRPPPSPWKPPPRDEPHSWSPRATVRRGG